MFDQQAGSEVLVCPDCEKSFPGESTLSWHRQTVHGPGHSEVLSQSQSVPHWDDEETALAEEDELTLDGMRGDLRGWGVALIGLGIAQYFIPFLDPLWAFVVIPLGVLSFLVAHRVFFIVIGATLILVGLLNVFSGGFGGWTIYGVAQAYWGIQEIRKFEKYAEVS